MQMVITHVEGSECIHKAMVVNLTDGDMHTLRNALIKHAIKSAPAFDILVQLENAMQKHGIKIEDPVLHTV